MIDFFILPSLLAITLKIAIFLRYHGSLRRENIDLGLFFLAVFFLNIAELFSINAGDHAENTQMLILLAYYCSVIFIIHSFASLSLEYSGFQWQKDKIKLGLKLALAVLILATIFSRSVIAGVEPMNYSLTRLAGENYWLFQIYALSGLVFAVGLLVRGLRKITSNIGRQRCLVVLLSASAPILMTMAVIVLMALGININGAIFMSLALTFMLAMMVYAEEKTRLFRLLTFVPYSRERRFHKKLLQQITQCISISDDPNQQQSLQLKEMMKEFEGSVVEHVLTYYDGNQKKTASALGVSEATVSRRARARHS